MKAKDGIEFFHYLCMYRINIISTDKRWLKDLQKDEREKKREISSGVNDQFVWEFDKTIWAIHWDAYQNLNKVQE